MEKQEDFTLIVYELKEIKSIVKQFVEDTTKDFKDEMDASRLIQSKLIDRMTQLRESVRRMESQLDWMDTEINKMQEGMLQLERIVKHVDVYK